MSEEQENKEKKKSLKPLIALNIVLAFILLCVLLVVYRVYDPPIVPVDTIPAFGMQSVSGGSFGNDDLSDRAFVLNVFASWCKPCEAEHPYLSQLAYEHNIPLYGIALKDDEDDLKAFLKRLGNPYHDIGMDNAGLMLSGLGIGGIPTTIVADPDQKIHMVYQGPITQEIIDENILPLVERINSQ